MFDLKSIKWIFLPRCLGCVWLVFMAGSLSFLSFSVFGEQEGICVDCVKGDQAEQEIQNLNKLTCKAQLNRPECKNVPNILRPDCDNLPKNPEAWAVGVCAPIMAGAVGGSFLAVLKLLDKSIIYKSRISSVPAGLSLVGRIVPLVTAGVAAGGAAYLAVKYHNQVGKVRREARQRGLDPKDEKGIKKQARQEFTLSLGKRVYDMLYGDSHCYNEVTQAARACGLMSGIGATAALAGGVSGGAAGAVIGGDLMWAVGGASGFTLGLLPLPFSLDELSDQYKEVQDDVQKRTPGSKGSGTLPFLPQ